jgi:hypothetical protein
MSKKGSERRQHPRVDARLAMQLDEEALGQSLVTTESMNISRGGVYCECPEFMAPLSKVALTVILPAFGGTTSSRMLRSEGVVVRCEPLPPVRGRKRYQLACCFTGLDAGSRAMLDEFVSWRAVKGRAVAAAARRAATPIRPAAKSAKKKSAAAAASARKPAAKKPAAKKAAPKPARKAAAKPARTATRRPAAKPAAKSARAKKSTARKASTRRRS